APLYSATSSPMRKTRESRRISSLMASRSASRNSISRVVVIFQSQTLRNEDAALFAFTFRNPCTALLCGVQPFSSSIIGKLVPVYGPHSSTYTSLYSSSIGGGGEASAHSTASRT